MIAPRRPLPTRLIRQRFRPLPATRGLRRRVPDDSNRWQPVGLRWRRIAVRSAGPGARVLAPARRTPPAVYLPMRGRLPATPASLVREPAPRSLPGQQGRQCADGRDGRDGKPGARCRIDHRQESRMIYRAGATILPDAERSRPFPGPAASMRWPLPRSATVRPYARAAIAPTASLAHRVTSATRASVQPALPAMAAHRRHANPGTPPIGQVRTLAGLAGPARRPGADRGKRDAAVRLGWTTPRRPAAALRTPALPAPSGMRTELVWRSGAPEPSGRHAPIGRSRTDTLAPADVSVPALLPPAAAMAPAVVAHASASRQASPMPLDAATTERLVEDVLRRAEQRLRIERERRGL